MTFASATLFHVLDVTPALGRLFTDDDAKPGFMDMTWPVPVLLSHALWVDRFGSDPDIIGRTIRMNDNSRVVVGVLPKGFAFPDAATQIWMLEQPMPRAASFASPFNLLDVARLRPGASVESASAELPGVLATIEGVYPDATGERMNALALTPKVVSLKRSIVGDVGGVLWTLFGGMTLLLTIAVANVSTLFAGRVQVLRPRLLPDHGHPILDGQSFGANEHVTEPHAVLVSAALARRLYPGETAIGKTVERLQRDGSPVTMGRDGTPIPPFTIVGVVGDVREASLRDEPSEVVYVPALDPPVEQSIVPTEMTVVVRTHGDPLSLTATLKSAIEAADPQLSVSRARTLGTIVNESRGTETFVGVLLLVAAIVAIALGIVGIYGNVAHVVRHRTREIGVRVALGASRADVVRAVASGSMRSALVGTAIGLVLTFEGSSLLRVLLFGVAPHDPLVMLIVTGALLAVGSVAALAGAARTADIAPISAMRVE